MEYYLVNLIKTPKHEIELILARLKRDEEDYEEWQRTK